MKQTPILFNSDMVKAILEGRKTMTRRIVHPVPLSINLEKKITIPYNGSIEWLLENRKSPFGYTGDRIWVRETWSDVYYEGNEGIAYKSDESFIKVSGDFLDDDLNLNYQDQRLVKQNLNFPVQFLRLLNKIEGKWRPSIHMPHWASRITLENIHVRIERLNQICDEDAIKEGVTILDRHMNGYCCGEYLSPAVRAFKELWESIYGLGSFDQKLVWVYEFNVIERYTA